MPSFSMEIGYSDNGHSTAPHPKATCLEINSTPLRQLLEDVVTLESTTHATLVYTKKEWVYTFDV
jgi:hypothetical protein